MTSPAAEKIPQSAIVTRLSDVRSERQADASPGVQITTERLVENPGWRAQFAFVAGLTVAITGAAVISGWLAGLATTGPWAVNAAMIVTAIYIAATLTILVSFRELARPGLGDRMNRVIGVIEASILAWFPTLIALLALAKSVIGPLPLFIALLGPVSVVLTGLTAALISSRLQSTGARLALVLLDGADGTAVPRLPIGAQSTAVTLSATSPDPTDLADALADAIRTGAVDQIYMVAPSRSADVALRAVSELNVFDIPVWFAPTNARFSQVIRLRSPMHSRVREAMKRGLDVVISLFAIIAMAIPCAIVAFLIWREDRGPIFFRQPRVGRNQVPFSMLKFRSMKVEELDERGDRLTTTNDDRITRIGQFLRRTSIDELPQFVNVLRGEMSIVGPRPLVIGFHFHGEAFAELIPDFSYRSRVRPGVTGLSQIRGLRGTPDTFEDAFKMMSERTICDNDYIERWSIWMDLRIIVMTVLSGAFFSRAY